MTTEQTIRIALRDYARIGGDAIIVERTDHPHIAGSYFYAIERTEKRSWTDGETALTQAGITDLWYAAGCPPWSGQQLYRPELANIRLLNRDGSPR